MKKLALAVIAFAAMFASVPADALTFSFSIANTFGNTAGTVTGKVVGLSDNTTSAASAIYVTGYPAAAAAPPYRSSDNIVTFPNTTVLFNTFTVTNGVLSYAHFYADTQGVNSGWFLFLSCCNSQWGDSTFVAPPDTIIEGYVRFPAAVTVPKVCPPDTRRVKVNGKVTCVCVKGGLGECN